MQAPPSSAAEGTSSQVGRLCRVFLLPPLHRFDHGHLFGLLLLVPGFKLQSENEGGAVRHRAGVGRGVEELSSSPVLDDPLDDVIRGQIVPAVDAPENPPPLWLLRRNGRLVRVNSANDRAAAFLTLNEEGGVLTQAAPSADSCFSDVLLTA